MLPGVWSAVHTPRCRCGDGPRRGRRRCGARVVLRPGHHGAAHAGLLRYQLDVTDVDCTSAPAVLGPAVAVDVDEHVGPEPAHVPVAGWGEAPDRRLAVVRTSRGAASTKRPEGIVHSIASLESSVASAKYSAWAGAGRRPPARPLPPARRRGRRRWQGRCRGRPRPSAG
jgi:hypothetical protein